MEEKSQPELGTKPVQHIEQKTENLLGGAKVIEV